MADITSWEYTGPKMAEVPELIATLPPEVYVLAMQSFGDMLVLATTRGVYRLSLDGSKFVAIPMVHHENTEVSLWPTTR